MSEWKKNKLGELIELKYGKDHKHLGNGNIPVYGSGGIMRYADKAIYSDVSILIPRKGSLNNIFYRDKPFWTVDTMYFAKVNKYANAYYLYSYLSILNLKHEEFENPDETQYRIIENYKYINTYYDKLLFDSDGNFDDTKFNYYLTYLLNRISIVEIEITSSHNVAMIFEVVNDRGLGLKPFEINHDYKIQEN